MPADAREQIRQLPSGKWQLRYYDRKGVRHSGGAFPSKSAARAHYRDVIEPGLNGKPVARRDLTYTDLVEVFLERHAIVAKPRTITELRWRLKQSRGEVRDGAARRAGGDGGRDRRVRRDAARAAPLPADGGDPAGARSGRPLRLPDPQPREARGAEPDAAATRDPRLHAGRTRRRSPTSWEPLRRPPCGSRPRPGSDPRSGRRSSAETWTRPAGCVLVRGTKTIRSRREVPLTTAALDALDQVPPQARQPLRVHDLAEVPRHRRAGPVRRRELPASRVGTGDRRGRDREARPDLRPPVDVRLERARGRDHDVRAGPDHGHEREDDRAALRHADRHRSRSDPCSVGLSCCQPGDGSPELAHQGRTCY